MTKVFTRSSLVFFSMAIFTRAALQLIDNYFLLLVPSISCNILGHVNEDD